MREDRTTPPESEKRPPVNKTIGFKPWNDEVERFWTGRQWSDTFKKIEENHAEAGRSTEATDVLQSNWAKEGDASLGILPDPPHSPSGTGSEQVAEASIQEQDGSEDSSAAEGSEEVMPYSEEEEKQLIAKIEVLRSRGANDTEIAKQLGVSDSMISRMDLLVHTEKALGITPKPIEVRDGSAMFEDTTHYDDQIDGFFKAAKLYVVGANAVETADHPEDELTVDNLYIVWWAFTLGNWKAMISTNVPGDGLYFEVTHNAAKEETYVDIYKKQKNHVFSHHEF